VTVPGFRHEDPGRTLVFGRGTFARAAEVLPERFTLLSTERALEGAGHVAGSAVATVIVPAGQVPDLAAALLDEVPGDGPLVALGGGRVIDTAKAIAAATGGRTVAAIPTSLSAAEMTGIHRHARGVSEDTPRVRAKVVLNDPELSASQPAEQLAASSANALGHALAAVAATGEAPIAQPVAHQAVLRLAAGWSDSEPDRDALALGALLAGWAVDHSGLGLHHALSQTAVREASLSHAGVNAALLPFTAGAMRSRHPEEFEDLDRDLGRPVEEVAAELRRLAGNPGLGPILEDPPLLERAVDTAADRRELRNAEPPVGPEEITSIYRSASA
jgi:maleylacetate reductase